MTGIPIIHPERPRLRLSVAIQTPEVEPVIGVALLTGTLEQKLEKAARFGADGVELMTVDPFRLPVPDLKRELANTGLSVAAIASAGISMALKLNLLHADPEISRKARERLKELVRFAGEVNAPIVTVGGFRGRAANVGPRAADDLKEILFKEAEFAQHSGVKLALEPLNRYETDLISNAAQALQFVTQVDHPALGILLDVFHMNIEEASWSGPFNLLVKAGRLLHTHVGDNNRLPAGQGMLDFRAILTALRDSGYSGFMSAELLAQPDPDTAAERTLAYLRPLVKEIYAT